MHVDGEMSQEQQFDLSVRLIQRITRRPSEDHSFGESTCTLFRAVGAVSAVSHRGTVRSPLRIGNSSALLRLRMALRRRMDAQPSLPSLRSRRVDACFGALPLRPLDRPAEAAASSGAHFRLKHRGEPSWGRIRPAWRRPSCLQEAGSEFPTRPECYYPLGSRSDVWLSIEGTYLYAIERRVLGCFSPSDLFIVRSVPPPGPRVSWTFRRHKQQYSTCHWRRRDSSQTCPVG